NEASYNPERTVTVSSATRTGVARGGSAVGAGGGTPVSWAGTALSGTPTLGITGGAGGAGRLGREGAAITPRIIRPTAARNRRSMRQVRGRGPRHRDGTGGIASSVARPGTIPRGVRTSRPRRAHSWSMKDKTGRRGGAPDRSPSGSRG